MIETKRLFIRPPCEADFSDLLTLQANPEVMRYVGSGVRNKETVAKGLAQAIIHQQKHGFSLGSVFDKENRQFVGRAGLIHLGYDDKKEVEIAYAFCPSYWKMGYATEIVAALVEWGFNHLSLPVIVAIVHPDNWGSRRVLEKAGFKEIKRIEYAGIQQVYYQMKNHK